MIKARPLPSLSLVAALLMTVAAQAQNVLYVNVAASGNNNGTSWTDAYTDLQNAIAAADQMDEIWIAEGIYKPTAGVDRTISFELDTNVSWYGGFGGSETSLDERDWVLHETVLNGNIGDPMDSTDNSYHLIYGYLDQGVNIVDGIIIEEGHANGTIGYGDVGGGMALESSNLLMRNCIVRRCYAEGAGGGVHATSSGFFLTNTRLEMNIGRTSGGGAYLWNGGVVKNCAFVGNQAIGTIGGSGSGSSGSGGGLFHNGGSVVDCLFEDNYAHAEGGALRTSTGQAINCRFVNNTALRYGGAIVSSGTALVYTIYGSTFINNRVLDPSYSGGAIRFDGGIAGGLGANVYASTFIGNHAALDGGAISFNYTKAELHSCVFDGNSSGRNGGAVAYNSGDRECRILNSTFVHNDAVMQGKALYDWSIWYDSTLVINSIFRDNAQPEIEHHPNGHALDMRRSVVQNMLPGTDLYDLDPLFVDALGADGIAGTVDDDLRLSAASPCIALGTPDTIGLHLFHVDADNDMRIAGIVDLGAYEVPDCGLSVSQAHAPPDTLTCASLLYLQADTPLVGIGMWHALGPMGGLSPTPQIQNGPYSPLMRFSFPYGDSYFEWSVEHCGVITRDTVRITRVLVPAAPVIVNLDGAVPLCPGQFANLSVNAAGTTVEWSTGESGSSIAVGPGTYTARLVNVAGCTGPWSAAFVVTAAAVPNQPAITVNGLLSLCANMGQSVTLSSGGSQLQYLWSTGATTSSIVVDTTGTFTLTVTNASGCTSVPSQLVNVVLHPQPPAPLLTLLNDTALCSGAVIAIGAAQTANSYHWSNGTVGNGITVSSAGQYYLVVGDAFGCLSPHSDTIHVTFHPLVTPTIVASGPLAFCIGDSVVLHTSPLFASYAWSNGSSAPSITVFATGPNLVNVVDANGCTGTSSNGQVLVYPLPTVPVITATFVSPGVFNLHTPFVTGATYTWYRAGVPLPGATTYFINGVTNAGPYHVTVTSSHGCSSTSVDFNGPVGIEDHAAALDFRIYPNPGSGIFHVQGGALAGGPLDVVVHDHAGRVVHRQRLVVRDPQTPVELDLGELANGTYHVQLSGAEGTGVVMVAIAR